MEDNRFNYMLLSRLQSDCDYFLGYGERHVKYLWAGSIDGQITKMRELYKTLPIKPEWLTMEQISDYAAKMGATV